MDMSIVNEGHQTARMSILQLVVNNPLHPTLAWYPFSHN